MLLRYVNTSVCATDKSLLVRSFVRLLPSFLSTEKPNEHKTENFNLAPVQLLTRYGNFGNFLQYSLWMRFYIWFFIVLCVLVWSMLFITTILHCSLSISFDWVLRSSARNTMWLMNAYIILISQYFPSPFFFFSSTVFSLFSSSHTLLLCYFIFFWNWK